MDNKKTESKMNKIANEVMNGRVAASPHGKKIVDFVGFDTKSGYLMIDVSEAYGYVYLKRDMDTIERDAKAISRELGRQNPLADSFVFFNFRGDHHGLPVVITMFERLDVSEDEFYAAAAKRGYQHIEE